MAGKEFQNYTHEQIGFEAMRQINEGHYRKITIEEAQAEMDEYLKLTPEEKASKKLQESNEARKWGRATLIALDTQKKWPYNPAGDEMVAPPLTVVTSTSAQPGV